MANKYLILLVEDESNIASFITTVLRANQYEVKRAATGEEALMMASSYCPDLIILDLGLPDIDGQKVLSTVRSWTQTPVIVVSARSHERDKVESLDLGADDYITKPFGTSELLARVPHSAAPQPEQSGYKCIGRRVPCGQNAHRL